MKRFLIPAVLVAPFLAGCVPGPNVGMGPLPLRSQSPIAPGRLTIRAEAPPLMELGAGSLALDYTWANHWIFSTGQGQVVQIDTETVRFELRGRYAWRQWLTVGADVGASARFGGLIFMLRHPARSDPPSRRRSRAERSPPSPSRARTCRRAS